MSILPIAKALMAIGALLILFGAVLFIGSRLGLGRLPGDIAWQRGNTSVYFPVITSIVVSLVLTVVLNLLMRLFR
jgi:hypothetical protein